MSNQKNHPLSQVPFEQGQEQQSEPNFLLTARQTLITWVKEGQLLCIPDKVETSVSGENKHELSSAWQIKPPDGGDAKTSGLNERWFYAG